MSDKLKILVVDDNVNFLQLAEIALSGDYDIVTASDGREGLDKAARVKPDLILMDVMMPGVGGLEALRMLLSEEETRGIPVIIMTASHFDPSTEQVFTQEQNVKAFLIKPCPVNILKETILSILKK